MAVIVLISMIAVAACEPTPTDISGEPIFNELPPGATVLATGEQPASFMNDSPSYSIVFASPWSERRLTDFYVQEHGFRPTPDTGTDRRTPWRDGTLLAILNVREWRSNGDQTAYGVDIDAPPGTRSIGHLSAGFLP